MTNEREKIIMNKNEDYDCFDIDIVDLQNEITENDDIPSLRKFINEFISKHNISNQIRRQMTITPDTLDSGVQFIININKDNELVLTMGVPTLWYVEGVSNFTRMITMIEKIWKETKLVDDNNS